MTAVNAPLPPVPDGLAKAPIAADIAARIDEPDMVVTVSDALVAAYDRLQEDAG